MDFEEIARQLRKPEGENGVKTGDIMNKGNAALYALTLSCMEIRNDEQVLEIGFGNGKLIPEVLKQAPQAYYYGIDFSETMVQEATGYNRQLIEEGRIQIQKGNISVIPFQEGKFDKVFTLNTIYFWDKPEQDIKEVFRVLKKGGKVYIGIRPKDIMEKIPFVRYGFRTYSYEDVKILLETAGFTDITFSLREEQPMNIDGNEFQIKGMCISGVK